MILYTPLATEDIYPYEALEQSNDRQVISYNGKEVYAEHIGSHEYKVLQLMSTNPDDFLRSDLQPGATLVLNEFK